MLDVGWVFGNAFAQGLEIPRYVLLNCGALTKSSKILGMDLVKHGIIKSLLFFLYMEGVFKTSRI